MNIFMKAFHNNTEAIKDYLVYKDVNASDVTKKTLLHHAVLGSALEVAEILLENYINVDAVDELGQTALFIAVSQSRYGMTKLLLRYNASCNIIDNKGENIMFMALKYQNMATIETILPKVDLSLKNNIGENLLHLAFKYNYPNFIKLANKKNVHDVTIFGDTIFHYAVKFNNMDAVKFCGSTFLDIRNNEDESIFDTAVRYSNRDIINYLVQFKPNIDGVNKFGEDIFDYANLNSFDVLDIVEGYKYTLDYLNYATNYPVIHKYRSGLKIDINEYTKKIIQKKDSNKLSLIDYASMLNDEKMILIIESYLK